MAVPALSIVEHLYVVEDVSAHPVARFVDLILDPFLFQAAEEGLSHRIVPIIASSIHAWFEVMRDTEAIPGVAAVLRALVRMHDDRLNRAPSPHGHQQGIENEFFGQRRLHGPTDDRTGEEIDDDGEVQPALSCPDVRDVGDPGLVRPADGELSLQAIRHQDRRCAE